MRFPIDIHKTVSMEIDKILSFGLSHGSFTCVNRTLLNSLYSEASPVMLMLKKMCQVGLKLALPVPFLKEAGNLSELRLEY